VAVRSSSPAPGIHWLGVEPSGSTPACVSNAALGSGRKFDFRDSRRIIGQSKRGTPRPLVADIRDHERIWSIFTKYRPQIVLHAAAYKHVPVMEHNCAEAVLNNVLGTRTIAETAVGSAPNAS